MTAYSRIEKNLKDLDSRYQNDDDTDAYFTSKLAILELCGWIEEAMDECITSAYAGRLKHKANRKFIEAKVRRNFGFDYDRNFKPMIVALVGILGFEKISNGINADVFKRLKDDLDELKKARNSLAHTYTTDATERCDAPSVTIGRLANVKAGLDAYGAALKEYCTEDRYANH